MLRWQERTNDALNKTPADGGTIYDFMYAFFQSTYHLRDWLVSDGVATKEKIKLLFISSVELQLCCDVCNATKHLRYDNYTIDPKPRINREWNHYRNKDMGFSLYYFDKKRPIPELMAQCVQAWYGFQKTKDK